MKSPDISVIMSVYNGAEKVNKTILSILSQSNVEFEFLIVNDGSDESTTKIMSELQTKDARINLISQTNQGLTRSLITACKLAQGRYIARQDNGDISLPNRLSTQLKILTDNPNAVMTSTGVSFFAPDNELLYSVEQTRQQAHAGLLSRDINLISGPPHHGSVMFNKDAYFAAGGYREEFVVAQDLDLWTRLIELGAHVPTPGIFYHAAVEKDSISIVKRKLQFTVAEKIIECAKARETFGNDANVIESMTQIDSSSNAKKSTRASDSNYYYYLGSALLGSNPRSSAKYLKKSVHLNPFKVKAIIKFLVAILKKKNNETTKI